MLTINNDYNLLFIHIPKCAGTSIEAFFGYNYDDNKYIEHTFDIGHPKHLKLNEYSHVLSRSILEHLFKFTIIRNPFDLVVSLYNYGIHSDKVVWNGRNDYEFKKTIPFTEYVKFLYNLSTQKNKDRLNTTVVSLDEYIVSDIQLDFIGRFENLQTDFKHICSELNLHDENIPFENKSTKIKNNYQDYYDINSKDIIGKIFNSELKKYNYDF